MPLVSFCGLFAMIGVAWLLSSQRRAVRWQVVIGGVLLQFAFAAFILETYVGRQLFTEIGNAFQALLGFVKQSSAFMFGMETEQPAPDGAAGRTTQLLTSFAFSVLPTIVFFSSLMAILYHVGLMQRVVQLAGWIMRRTLGTSGVESLSAAANIFVGQTEAPLVVRPYVAGMTLSELNAVMVGGFATIAGGVMAAYVGMGVDAGHLVTASVISAPAALLIAKVMLPETEPERATQNAGVAAEEERGVNLIEAAAIGATDGLKLALNVGAMLIAFLALLAMANALLGYAGRLFDANSTWSFEEVLGYGCWPFAWLMGIPQEDCFKAGELLGVRIVANEFVAYAQLQEWRRPGSEVVIQERTATILTYALCGFANFGSIGVQLGGIGAIAPQRRADLARLGLRAMVGGLLACYMTACVAGVLI